MSSSSPPFAFIPSEESSNPLRPLYLCTTFGLPQCKTMQCRLCTSSQIVFIGDLSHERDVQFARNVNFFLCTCKMTVMLIVLNQATDEKSPNWKKKVKTIGKELRGERGSEVWRQATANTVRLWLWNNGRVHLQCKNGSNTQRKMLDETKLRQISHIIYIKNITYKKRNKDNWFICYLNGNRNGKLTYVSFWGGEIPNSIKQ